MRCSLIRDSHIPPRNGSPRSAVAALALGAVLAALGAPAFVAVARAGGDPPLQQDGVIEQALDQTVKRISISDLPLLDALAKIDKETGVHFAVDATVLDLMPYGAKTRVTLLIEATPLRIGLQQMLDRMGLTMRVDKDRVHIDPAPALARLGRRIAVSELRLLEKLAAASWPVSGNPPVAGEPPVPLQYVVDPALRPEEAFRAAIARSGPGPATRQLENAAASLNWVWMPEESRVVVYTRTDHYRRRLDAVIDLNYQRMPLDILMLDLGRRAGVPVNFEPGVLARVNATRRAVDLVERRTSPRQAFELLCGRTGLRYEICDAGVRITGQIVTRPAAPPPPTAISANGSNGPSRAEDALRSADSRSGVRDAVSAGPAAAAEPVTPNEPALPEFPDRAAPPLYVRITIPIGAGGAMVEFLIPDDQLPPQLRALCDEQLQKLIKLLEDTRASERKP